MALRYFVLLVAACAQLALAQRHPLQVQQPAVPHTGAGTLKPNWVADRAGRTAWNVPAPIPCFPQVNANYGELAPLPGATVVAPWRAPAGLARLIPGSERPWNAPAQSSVAPCAPAIWGDQYWTTPTAAPAFLVGSELSVSPQESNWNGWVDQNTQTWNLGAPAADINTIQLPSPVELPQAPALPSPPHLPQVLPSAVFHPIQIQSPPPRNIPGSLQHPLGGAWYRN